MSNKKAKETSKFIETMKRLEGKYGKGTILTLETKPQTDLEVYSTGSLAFDHVALGIGGFAKGKLYELMGWEGCLDENTFIKHINVRQDGIVQNCKGSKIKNLYRSFHNRTTKTKNTIFNVISINNENRVFRNPILDVVKTGVKECFELTTSTGIKLKATKEHKFFTGTKYIPLEELNPGDVIFIHNNTTFKNNLNKRLRYEETTVKNYYKDNLKDINGSKYYRVLKHRLVYEANMNNLSYSAYKDLLNSRKTLEGLITIPEGHDIHHRDENTLNNSLSNLQLIDSRSHCSYHAKENHNNLRFVVVETRVESIISKGVSETYDIKCEFPYNNYIANSIVVHNSGKSTICGHVAAECQRKGGKVLYIDGEHAVDKTYFKALGVDTKTMLLSQPSSGDEGFNVALDMIKTGEIDLVIIDSDSSLIPKKSLDGDIGDHAIGHKAKLNSSAYPKLKTALSDNNVCVIVVSQYREKIGIMYGNPTVTQGGHALKFYSDCRIEIGKKLAKDGDIIYGNITKIKVTKNKMSAPFKICSFEIVYGIGIDKIGELMGLLTKYKLGRKRLQEYTFNDKKYDLDEFRNMINDDQDFYDLIVNKILEKINPPGEIEVIDAQIIDNEKV